MTDIARRGRILAASRRERPDRLPFFHYWRHSQIGWAERECRNRALHEIAAADPAPIVLCGDNLDGFLVSPDLFERFFLPVYEEQARLLHQRGKLMAVHMDGRLACLKSLIARTPIDIVEALHPPPMGDVSLAEALAAWPDKCVWIGFPSSVYAEGPEATRAYAVDLLEQAGPGDRLAVAMSTENLVSNENLLALTGVLEQAALPLARIRGGLRA